MTARQEELAAAWLDASLSAGEQTELLAALKTDPDFARAFAEEVEIHRGLQFGAVRSEAGDRRAAERILHYVRADQEGTRFAEGVKLRAMAGGRRRSGRFVSRGISLVGPAIAAAAAILVAALVGLLAYVSHRQRMNNQPETAERVETPTPLPQPSGQKAPSEAPQQNPETDRRRQEQIEEDLRRAAEPRKGDPSPKKEEVPPPVPPPPELRVAEGKPQTPSKPSPSSVEMLPALARLEKLQGDATVNGEKVAAGADLRDGAMVDAVLATLRFADGTTLELSGEATVHERLAGKRAAGKGITLTRGNVGADVARQPAGQAFLFMTVYAEVQVVGTRLSVQTGAETRVDVLQGQVRITSLRGGQVVTLSAGQGLELAGTGAPRGYLSGLRAVYYDQNTFKGAMLERTDREIDLSLDEAKNELPPVGSDRNFAVRWEGRFLAEQEGDYVFLLSIDGRVRFVFDGQDVVADKKDAFHPIQRSVVRRRLSPGWHEFLIEYGDDGGNSRCRLRYVPPGATLPQGENFQRDDSGWPIPPRLFSHLRK